MPLTWGLCLATLNRRDALLECVRLALSQSRPPSEIVIVDASEDWSATREAVAALLPDGTVRFCYEPATIRSSAAQRNQAARAASADILFLIDDDSFLYPDCAERILAVYEHPAAGDVVAVLGSERPGPPTATAKRGAEIDRKPRGDRRSSLYRRFKGSRLGQWFLREILLEKVGAGLIPYDPPRLDGLPAGLELEGLRPATLMPGFRTTARRAVVLAEPYEEALRYYASMEDLDASYRWRRHGLSVAVREAAIYHHTAASGRLPRRLVTALQVMNAAFLVRKNGRDPAQLKRRVRTLQWRRLLAEVLKDAVSRRWDFPQVRGVLYAMRHWRRIWDLDRDALDEAYPTLQREMMETLR
ncbi:MAG: glycosyltransferase family 2 protein [Pseudomonadota bacterium]